MTAPPSVRSVRSSCSLASSQTIDGTTAVVDKHSRFLPGPEYVEHAIASQSDKFWFEDGTVVIKVNDTLYKLYKGILAQQSEFFRSNITAVYKSPASKIGKRPVTYGDPQLVGVGSCDNPLVLLVNREDFELLLSHMFPKDYNSQNTFTISEWASIATISKTLEINSLRAAAITNILKTTDPLELIDVGKKHNLAECMTEGFRRLCVREDSLTLKEGQRLGLQYVIAIAHGRDLLSKDSKWHEIERVVLSKAGSSCGFFATPPYMPKARPVPRHVKGK